MLMDGRDEKGRFVPGWEGGPGRPKKGEALTDILKSKLNKEELAEKLIAKAFEDGDLAAMKYIYDRIDGRPKETIEGTFTEIPRYLGFQLPPDADEPEDSDTDTE
jgi:hypothetical protein